MKPPADKIGQLLMVGLEGEELTDAEKTLLAKYPIGNFILFSRNSREPGQIVALCRSLWAIRRDPPPFIAIDHEGGRVHRLPEPFTHFPPAAALGRKNDPVLAYRAGRAMAEQLLAVGVNLNFAPVLDVLSNPANPVIGDRSLGEDPNIVSLLGWELTRGLRDGGVIPCGKHFPGHGDTERDSHLELPVVNKNRRQLDAVELPPFVHAARNGIDSLMTAHVLYRALDPNRPATLSPAVVGGLLRSEMSYDGVVFGDDFDMGAIAQSYSPEDASSMGIEAGLDMIMFCQQSESAVRAFDSLCRKAERDPAISLRIEESFQRVVGLKRRYLKSFGGSRGPVDFAAHRKIAAGIQGS